MADYNQVDYTDTQKFDTRILVKEKSVVHYYPATHVIYLIIKSSNSFYLVVIMKIVAPCHILHCLSYY